LNHEASDYREAKLRFFDDGPWIPDELLVARDEGRVLFFCGAGVSRAKAGLPDFLGLAKSVLHELRVLPESPAQKFLDAAVHQDPIPGIGGILAADRIFALLEREFSVTDIERAVGAALKPRDKVDLSAHRTLLALSRDARGRVKLITTNFDRLFEAAAPRSSLWTPNRLPDPRSVESFEGIVHLHGLFAPDYEHAVGGRLVLSSAEFGRAYLAEGWAADFIRAVIPSYLIVFVGYAADDPPVQYLLEALNRVVGFPRRGLYAFQDGREEDARARWTQKGVSAIAYAPDDGHAALWEALNAWADRARDPERWRERLIRRARRGPQALQPHERGQIVHLASTEDGARSISQAKRVLPASWLCVFDPAMRYGQPGKAKPLRADSPDVDPFTEHSLDSDPPPLPTSESQLLPRRDIPAGVIDVLAPSPLDPGTTGGHFHGRETLHAAQLSPRLISLAVWLGHVCGEPAAVWWASGQAGLHPAVIQQIEFTLNQRELSTLARSSWGYLLEAWRAAPAHDNMNAFALKNAIGKDGWTRPHIRRFGEISRCILTASRPYWAGPLPPGSPKRLRLQDLVDLEVRYPERLVSFEIPDEQLVNVIPVLRQNLEDAVDLQREINPRGFPLLAPIEPDPNLVGESAVRDFGINRSMLDFAELFCRLVQYDKAAALHETAAWRRHNDPVFGRLRIWAAGCDEFLDGAAASEVLAEADDEIFWNSHDQRDLLLSLRHTWPTMAAEIRTTIERRLLAGPPPVKGASAASNRQWRALVTLDRVTWLREQGCVFSTKVETTLARLRKAVPQWTPGNAVHAADSREMRGGFVTTDTSFGDLANVPISELITRAIQGQRRVWGESLEYDPFGGLCEKYPVRVLAGLRYEQRKGTDVTPLWTKFLPITAQRADKPKIARLIARRLTRLPQPVLGPITMAASYWLESAHNQLYERDPEGFRLVFDKLVDTLATRPASAEPRALTPGEKRDWVGTSLGSAAGRLAQALLGDPDVARLGPEEILPDAWLAKAERVLSLPDDHGRFGLVQFARHLGWLHNRAAAWSERHIVSEMLGDGASRDAALAGFLSNPQVGDNQLYVLLKPSLIDLSSSNQESQQCDPLVLGRFFVGGWLTRDGGERWLGDDEFRRVLIGASDPLRTHVLWQVGYFEFAEKIEFLQKVWPRQLVVRTPTVVGRLCTLAFDDATHFPELISAILPLVSEAEVGSMGLLLPHDRIGKVVEKYPDRAFDLLAAVLPGEIARWPYGMDETLARLIKAKPALVTDPRMIRLKAIWDKR
jgi:hypothetical protein